MARRPLVQKAELPSLPARMADSRLTTPSMDMRTEENGEEPLKDTGNRDALLGGIALGVLLAVMALWFFYPYPSGKHPSFVDFLLFWGREVILVLFFLGALVFGGLAVVWRAIACVFSRRPPRHNEGDGGGKT